MVSIAPPSLIEINILTAVGPMKGGRTPTRLHRLKMMGKIVEKLEQLIRRAMYFDYFGIGLDLLNLIDFKAYTALLASSNMTQSRSVLDFGCGRGILAYRLLTQFPNVVSLVAVDLSHRCMRTTQNRLSSFGQVNCYVGSLEQIPARFAIRQNFSSFVLDTMPVDKIAIVLDGFHKILEPGGLVCLLSASPG